MTLSQSPQRWQVAIPAQGIIELRNILTDILAEFGPADYSKLVAFQKCEILTYRHLHQALNTLQT